MIHHKYVLYVFSFFVAIRKDKNLPLMSPMRNEAQVKYPFLDSDFKKNYYKQILERSLSN